MPTRPFILIPEHSNTASVFSNRGTLGGTVDQARETLGIDGINQGFRLRWIPSGIVAMVTAPGSTLSSLPDRVVFLVGSDPEQPPFDILELISRLLSEELRHLDERQQKAEVLLSTWEQSNVMNEAFATLVEIPFAVGWPHSQEETSLQWLTYCQRLTTRVKHEFMHERQELIKMHDGIYDAARDMIRELVRQNGKVTTLRQLSQRLDSRCQQGGGSALDLNQSQARSHNANMSVGSYTSHSETTGTAVPGVRSFHVSEEDFRDMRFYMMGSVEAFVNEIDAMHAESQELTPSDDDSLPEAAQEQPITGTLQATSSTEPFSLAHTPPARIAEYYLDIQEFLRSLEQRNQEASLTRDESPEELQGSEG